MPRLLSSIKSTIKRDSGTLPIQHLNPIPTPIRKSLPYIPICSVTFDIRIRGEGTKCIPLFERSLILGVHLFQFGHMETEIVKCECCGLKEDCTQEYINGVRANFQGKWLCGLCSEAVRDEVMRGNNKPYGTLEEAVNAHMSFRGKFRSNPAVRVADGMRQMLRKRSGDLSSPSSNKFGRSATVSPRCS